MNQERQEKVPTVIKQLAERNKESGQVKERLKELHSVYHQLLVDFGSGRVEYRPVKSAEQIKKGPTVWGYHVLWELPKIEISAGEHQFEVAVQTVPLCFSLSSLNGRYLAAKASLEPASNEPSIRIQVKGPRKSSFLLSIRSYGVGWGGGYGESMIDGRRVVEEDIKQYTELAGFLRERLEKEELKFASPFRCGKIAS